MLLCNALPEKCVNMILILIVSEKQGVSTSSKLFDKPTLYMYRMCIKAASLFIYNNSLIVAMSA